MTLRASRLLNIIGPGLLITATGVGAGDLAGGAFAGSKLGVTVLWAVILGAFLKYVVTEGLARWQLATGETLLEGAIKRLGKPLQVIFLSYLLIWSYWVGSALINACGIAGSAFFAGLDPVKGKIVFGILHSIIGLTLVWFGSYERFEKIMSFGIGLMFTAVIITAIRIVPAMGELFHGFVPSIPEYITADGVNQGPVWTVALMGGVGGTLTVLSYGYWIREKGRIGIQHLNTCRIDLIVAYTVTALFGIAMVLISSQTDLDKQASAQMIIVLADRLGETLGSSGRIVFLVGAWAAIFSSLLGVWQAVPYLFADFWRISQHNESDTKINVRSPAYRGYLLALTFIPMIGLGYKFVAVQKIYAVLGALVIPLLAILLLILNSRKKWMYEHRNRPITIILLLATVVLFGYIGMPSLLSVLL
ncbi:Nramp family divalent metal transporter [bacterium]|nr:Nramp family divalent metal transporter [bacterium]